MAFDRRSILAAAVALPMFGCTSPPRNVAAPPGLSDWSAFRARFVRPDGRVVDTGNDGVSHSEGQGYAMLLAVFGNDRPTFDRVLGWTEATLARSDVALFSWRYLPGATHAVADPNNATDGDTLIAWALMRAARRWNHAPYAARAAEIRQAIRAHLVNERIGKALLLPGLVGFDQPDRLILNPSYYVWPALDAFAEVDGAAWHTVIEDGLWLLLHARFGEHRLPTDWIDVRSATEVVPAEGRPARFGFDAIRVPLYLLLSGRRGPTEEVARFWRSLAAAGRPLPAWVDVIDGAFAPYPLSTGGTAVADRLLDVALPPRTAVSDSDYYSSVLGLLAQLDTA